MKLTATDQITKFKASAIESAEQVCAEKKESADLELEAIKWLVKNNVAHEWPEVLHMSHRRYYAVFRAPNLSDKQRKELRVALKKAPFAWQIEGNGNTTPAYAPKAK